MRLIFLLPRELRTMFEEAAMPHVPIAGVRLSAIEFTDDGGCVAVVSGSDPVKITGTAIEASQ